ncbi:hypothetical protein BDR07DRAFT_1500786 [Suillus spraguei]|nr:hypothetical protein BDR07DRAFT_1500786 [Suillus spraguei]
MQPLLDDVISYSNVRLTPVSASIGKLQNPLDVIVGESSSLETGVGSRRQELIDGKADLTQPNTLRTGHSTTISHLPTEILSEIFLYCLPTDKHLSPTPRQAPILLTKICHRWREIAVGLPRLWCNPLLKFDGRYDWDKRAFCYRYWLERSRGCPLSLRIEYDNEWSELPSLVQPYVRQVSSLALNFKVDNEPFMIEDFDRLKDLTIRRFPFSPTRVIIRTLSKLPVNLRSINMPCIMFSRKGLDLFTDPAWARLTHVEIALSGVDAFPRLLRLCPSVSFLAISGIFCPFQTAELAFTHTNLQTLHMSAIQLQRFGEDIGLFDVVTLPNLRVIEVLRFRTWPHEQFKAFLTRSRCPLEKLVLPDATCCTARQRAEHAILFPSLEIIAASPADVM